MGTANGASMATIADGGIGRRQVVMVATNNAGSAGNGVNLYALDAGTGAVVWQWNHLYTRSVPDTATTVPNDPPAVPSVANVRGDGAADDRVFLGDLDGRLWSFDAGKGTATVLYDPGTDGYPIAASVALYRTSDEARRLAALVVTGGRDWVAPDSIQRVISVDVTAGSVLFSLELAGGERGYAMPTVAGDDAYLVTTFGNFVGNISGTAHNPGNLIRLNLSTGTVTAVTAMTKGASEVAVGVDGEVFVANAGGATRSENVGHDPDGRALNDRATQLFSAAWL
jgi:outer membrane protein assembly factor BamB